MLTTSFSLPMNLVRVWRQNSSAILRHSVRFFQQNLAETAVRRGTTRKYNRVGGDFAIVTTRVSESQYDMLHCVAAGMRVSVSSLICSIIKLWLQAGHSDPTVEFVTNYSCTQHYSGPNGLMYSENLRILPVPPPLR